MCVMCCRAARPAVPTRGGCLGDLLLGGAGRGSKAGRAVSKTVSWQLVLRTVHEGVMVAWQGPWGREKGR